MAGLLKIYVWFSPKVENSSEESLWLKISAIRQIYGWFTATPEIVTDGEVSDVKIVEAAKFIVKTIS